MRQIYLGGAKEIVFAEVEKPAVEAGWLLIKTARCGICGTDAHGYQGETIFGKVFPFHIGHEVCGYVEETGSESSAFAIGDLVVINPFFTCNSCQACFMDQSNNCSHRTTIGLKGPGGFSEYILVPESSTLKAGKGSDVNRLCLAEPLGNVIYAMDKLKINTNMRVLILGAGAIGLMFLQLVKGQMPAGITVCDFNTEKLEKARKLGADRILHPDRQEDGSEYEVIIDCTGSASCVEDAIHRLSFGGQFLSFGVCAIDAGIRISPFELYKKDAVFLSSFALNKSALQKAVSLLEHDQFHTELLTDSIQPVSRLEESLQKMCEGTTAGKIIIDTNGKR